MEKNTLSLILYASPSYVTEIAGASTKTDNSLFGAISETYLPLLSMLSGFEQDGIQCKIGLVLPPAVCTMLADPRVQKLYLDSLDRRIALGESECKRLSSDKALRTLAERYLNKARKDKSDFTETYGENLLDAFKSWAKKGYVELIPTCATGAFLPHYADMTEILNAQVETGLYAQRQFFGDTGEGFFLPYMGYASGVEKVLRSYGVSYTVLDARSFLFSKDEPATGIFLPLRAQNFLSILANDPKCLDEINGEDGYAKNPVYRSQQFDIGFDLDAKSLEAVLLSDEKRVPTLYRYWSCLSDGSRSPYNAEAAFTQAKNDAVTFVQKRDSLLKKAKESLTDKNPSLVCAIPLEFIGQDWYEGTAWLDTLVRTVSESESLNLTFCKDLVQNHEARERITPYPCASFGSGYGEPLLDSTNSWMMRYVRKASERMIDLSERFPSETGLRARLLNIAAREVLLAESGEWPRLLSEGFGDEISTGFKEHILSFTNVFDSLASNTVSTEWLTRIEKEHSIFPWMNYRIFSRKK